MSDNKRAISYAYDDLGHLLAVNYFKEQTHNYEYDYRGYLIRDNNLRIEYDNNGNILKKGDVSYTYDPLIKDRLIKVGNETIEYDANNPLIPTKYLDKRLKFEGKRLKEVTKNNKTSYFYYDEEGYLIKKIDGNGKTTNFVYENGNLLYLKKDNNEFDFLYDENNFLYGFILNKCDTYYYLRDIFNNILGILDCQGEIIVSYEYDAFGKIIKTEDLFSIQLGSLNPFKYKGYYYDEEIELYYLISRFYDANIGRFISPDSNDYLDKFNVNGLNLYIYCKNDPVNFFDPYGRSATMIILCILAALLFTDIGGKIFQEVSSLVCYVGFAIMSIRNEEIRKDMNQIGWNPFNSNVDYARNSSVVSFYKGVLVIKIDGSRSCSFGIIFLKGGANADELRHERGHNWQLMSMGIATYGITVGIPSTLMLGGASKRGNYYNVPWETMADIFGGVKEREHTDKQKKNAWIYYIFRSSLLPYFYW